MNCQQSKLQLCVIFLIRKRRGKMENVNRPIHGLIREKFHLKNMLSVTEKGLIWSSKEFLAT